MFSAENIRRSKVMVFLAIYLLSVFSVFAKHDHNSGFYFKDYHFKGVKNSVSKSEGVSDNTACAVCHLQQTSFTYSLPEGFSVSINPEFYFSDKIFYREGFSSNSPGLSLFLRGPPKVLYVLA